MPTESKMVDKFTLIDILSAIQKSVENDEIKSSKITFVLNDTGTFNVTVFFTER